MMKELTVKDYNKEVKHFKGRSLIDFYSPSCGPCRALKPVLEAFAKESGIKVLMVDVGEEGILTKAYGVDALPTLIAVENGHIIGKAQGLQKKANLYELFQQVHPN